MDPKKETSVEWNSHFYGFINLFINKLYLVIPQEALQDFPDMTDVFMEQCGKFVI